MRKLKRLIVISAICATTAANAQEKTGDVILDAMQDELWRNMKALKLPDAKGPFYIMYGVQDEKTYLVSGTLGALTSYSETPRRFRTNTRVLCGDYDFNDESLDDNHYSSSTVHEIEIPVDADYFGIRRSFWASNDQVYRDAARLFQKHQQTVKESGKELKDIPHRSFAKSEPVKLLPEFAPYKWNKDKFVSLVRNLSSKFLKHAEIENSGVVIRFVEGQRYYVTSEGTIARIPFSIAGMSIYARLRNDEGEYIFDQISYDARTPDGFPVEEKLASAVDAMIDGLLQPKEEIKFEDEFTGPVLVMGSNVAELFSGVFLRGKDGLIASDNIPKLKGYQLDQSGKIENRLGKPIAHESITVKARPTLESFQNIELLGSYKIDGEAIVPPDELVLVEKGVLKNLLNDRSNSSTSSQVFPSGFNNGPGVVEITSSIRNTMPELKAKLVQKAKEEGLDYAFIVKNDKTGFAGMQIFRVSVKDGKEELLKNARFERPSTKSIKNGMLGVSSTYNSYNLMGQRYENGAADVISYIVPEAVLLDEGEIKPFNQPTLKEEHFVSNPLAP